MKTFLRPTPQQLHRSLKRTPKCLRWACRGAYTLSARLSDVEDCALHKLRDAKAIAWRRQRKMRSWAAKHPRFLLLAFPLWGDPRSFAELPEQKLWPRILGVFALVSPHHRCATSRSRKWPVTSSMGRSCWRILSDSCKTLGCRYWPGML